MYSWWHTQRREWDKLLNRKTDKEDLCNKQRWRWRHKHEDDRHMTLRSPVTRNKSIHQDQLSTSNVLWLSLINQLTPVYTCLNSLPELCRTATSVSRSSAQTASPQQTVWGFWGSWGGRNCCYWTWGRLRTGGRGPPSGAGGTGSWWGVRVSGGDRPVYGSGLWSQSSQAMEQIERLVIKANYRDYGESRN